MYSIYRVDLPLYVFLAQYLSSPIITTMLEQQFYLKLLPSDSLLKSDA